MRQGVIRSFSELKRTTFRVNTLKRSVPQIKEELSREGFRLDPINWYRDAFILGKGHQRDLERMGIYGRGEIYLQNPSSMIPPLVLDPQPGETVLDLTAAPGSKTTQMAVLMKNKGRIVAVESNPVRLEKLESNIERQGCKIVEIVKEYGEVAGRKWRESVDRVLLDAPCSAEGRFFLGKPATYLHWSLAGVLARAKQQKKLLRSAFLALKPGGVLVYSTCTFAPEENERNIEELLQWAPEAKIESIAHPLPPHQKGLCSWDGGSFEKDLQNTVRILPTPVMEAFFVARLRKI